MNIVRTKLSIYCQLDHMKYTYKKLQSKYNKIYTKTMISWLLAILSLLRCLNILCDKWNRIRLTNLKDVLIAANVINVVFEQ